MQISSATGGQPYVPTRARSGGDVVALQAAAKEVTKAAVATDTAQSAGAMDAASLMVRGQVDPMNADAVASIQQAMGIGLI